MGSCRDNTSLGGFGMVVPQIRTRVTIRKRNKGLHQGLAGPAETAGNPRQVKCRDGDPVAGGERAERLREETFPRYHDDVVGEEGLEDGDGVVAVTTMDDIGLQPNQRGIRLEVRGGSAFEEVLVTGGGRGTDKGVDLRVEVRGTGERLRRNHSRTKEVLEVRRALEKSVNVRRGKHLKGVRQHSQGGRHDRGGKNTVGVPCEILPCQDVISHVSSLTSQGGGRVLAA
jgi:hypothetical protein